MKMYQVVKGRINTQKIGEPFLYCEEAGRLRLKMHAVFGGTFRVMPIEAPKATTPIRIGNQVYLNGTPCRKYRSVDQNVI